MQGTQLISYLAKSHPSVVLVGVTKNRDLQGMKWLLDQGLSCLGESYLEEASRKFGELTDTSFEKHFIGHVQSRKVAKVVSLFDVIQSVDSPKLLKKIDRYAQELDKKQCIFLQVNLTGETTKYGCSLDDLPALVELCGKLESVDLSGLMCMGCIDDHDRTREAFQKLRKLCDQYELKHCSMGMSDDWQIALQEGSTMLRLGRILFADSD